jgi:hypothetical protein
MLKLIKKIIFAPYVGAKWVGALESTAKEDYFSAINKLNDLTRFFENRNVEYHLLKGFLEFAINDDQSSIEDIRQSIRLLEKSTKYNHSEKNYLKCYAATYGNLANENMPTTRQVDKFEVIPWGEVDLQHVSRALKKNFPLRTHPNWIE